MKLAILKKFKFPEKTKPATIEIVSYKHINRLRLLTILIIVLLISLLLGTAWFAYKRINNTIGQAEPYLFLQAELGIEPIDFTALNEVMAEHHLIRDQAPIMIERDPFHLPPVPVVIAPAPATPVSALDERP